MGRFAVAGKEENVLQVLAVERNAVKSRISEVISPKNRFIDSSNLSYSLLLIIRTPGKARYRACVKAG